MRITIESIKKLNPCQHSIDDFESKHPEYSDTLENLLMLEDVPYSDKTWLATKVLDIKILQQWSVNCAEFVVDNYNKEFPDDSRISDCIDATRRYLIGYCSREDLSAAQSAAWSAVKSAELAESASWSAWSAAESAVQSVAWSAAQSAQSAAWSAVKSAELAGEQQDINLSLLIALL